MGMSDMYQPDGMYDPTDDVVEEGDPGLEEAHFYWTIGQFDNLFHTNRVGFIVGAMKADTVDKQRTYFANKR